MLELIIRHLKAVSMKCHKNKMSVFNLGVVFGPTLLRAAEETLAAILDIKFNNVVIEILIENYDLIFKNAPGRTSDYITHSNSTSHPEPVPRSYGAYRTNRSAVNNSQPVVRVVTRANYTDTVMSSSLQNISNGVGAYQNTSKSIKPVQQIYESKAHLSQLNQSTPSLPREAHQIFAPTGRDSITTQPIYMSTTMSSSPNTNNISGSHSPIHRSGNSSMSGGHLDHSMSPFQSSHVSKSIGKTWSKMVYLTVNFYISMQPQRLNAMNYSESNLIHPINVTDRINSTSSSNESVCSTSSLNQSFPRQTQSAQQTAQSKHKSPSQTANQQVSNYLDISSNKLNSSTTRDEASQNVMPKKTQRTKEFARQRYHSPRENV